MGTDNNLCGVIIIDKEAGYTSQDVVAIVRKTLGRVKAGHAGTLDPAATGVLPVMLGRATRLSDYLMAETKVYETEVVLGIRTDSQDMTGNILSQSIPNADKAAITAAVNSFIGDYMQTPPMFSAIKVDGKRLYKLARAGQEIERQPRPVQIHSIAITGFAADLSRFTMTVTCSKGTYIRTLCADIGELLGFGACMGLLRRMSTGTFDISQAVTLNKLKGLAADGIAETAVISVLDALPNIRRVELPASLVTKAVLNGGKLSIYNHRLPSDIKAGEQIFLLSGELGLVGLYTAESGSNGIVLKPDIMFI